MRLRTRYSLHKNISAAARQTHVCTACVMTKTTINRPDGDDLGLLLGARSPMSALGRRRAHNSKKHARVQAKAVGAPFIHRYSDAVGERERAVLLLVTSWLDIVSYSDYDDYSALYGSLTGAGRKPRLVSYSAAADDPLRIWPLGIQLRRGSSGAKLTKAAAKWTDNFMNLELLFVGFCATQHVLTLDPFPLLYLCKK